MKKIFFISACAQFLSERYGDVFVDDSNLGITETEFDPNITLQENIEQQTQRIQRDTKNLAQHYERLLTATGGALNIKKMPLVNDHMYMDGRRGKDGYHQRVTWTT